MLYLLQQTVEKMTKVYPQHGEYSLGAHLYTALTSNDYLKWKKESGNTKQAYDLAAHQVIKDILIRAITLQQDRINYLFENPLFIEKDSPGQIAYAARFPEKPLKPQRTWEYAVQYLFYVWHQKITQALRGFNDLPSGPARPLRLAGPVFPANRADVDRTYSLSRFMYLRGDFLFQTPRGAATPFVLALIEV